MSPHSCMVEADGLTKIAYSSFSLNSWQLHFNLEIVIGG
jgi:hypothetical protein